MLILEEIYVKRIIPAIRSYIVKNHDPRIMTWSELARKIGVTPPAVKKYAATDIYRYIPPQIYSEIEEDLIKFRNLLYKPGVTRRALNETLMNLWISWVSRGIICRLIKRYSPSLEEDCREVTSYYIDILINRAILEVEKAFTIFRSIPSIARYIPEVSTNIVRLIEAGDNPSRYPVVGFPGRIVAVNNEVRVYDRPVIGGSRHMGRVLRKLHILNRDIKGLTGIGYNHGVEVAANKLGMDKIDIDAVSDDALIELIVEPADIIIDRGGYGRIPFIYISGVDAQDAVNKLKDLIEYVEGYLYAKENR